MEGGVLHLCKVAPWEGSQDSKPFPLKRPLIFRILKKRSWPVLPLAQKTRHRDLMSREEENSLSLGLPCHICGLPTHVLVPVSHMRCSPWILCHLDKLSWWNALH